MTLECPDAGDARQLRTRIGTRSQTDEACLHLIAAIGLDDPAQGAFIPANLGHLGLEAGLLVEAEMTTNRTGIFRDFRSLRIFFGWYVADLLQQRQVHIGLHVARCARIAIPVPDSAEIGTPLYHANLLDACFAQATGGQQPGKSAAHDNHIHLVPDRRAGKTRNAVGIILKMGKLVLNCDILRVAVWPQSFLALLIITLAQHIGLNAQQQRSTV
jgi:hypothetical protein